MKRLIALLAWFFILYRGFPSITAPTFVVTTKIGPFVGPAACEQVRQHFQPDAPPGVTVVPYTYQTESCFSSSGNVYFSHPD